MENKRLFGEMLLEKAEKQGMPAKPKNTKLLLITIPIQATTIRETVQQQFNAIEYCIDEVIKDMKLENLIK